LPIIFYLSQILTKNVAGYTILSAAYKRTRRSEVSLHHKYQGKTVLNLIADCRLQYG
jgi:hypothetical protein